MPEQKSKPSGNSSQMLNASSGVHPRYARHYIRRMRFDAMSPVFQTLLAAGYPASPENGQTWDTATTWVVSFPMKVDDEAVLRSDVTAISQLQYVARVRQFWTEHQPSVTIYYTPGEMKDIIEWVQENRDYVAGLSFLPRDDHAYQQPPYEEISESDYHALVRALPQTVDFSLVSSFENADLTTASGELACVAGACETL